MTQQFYPWVYILRKKIFLKRYMHPIVTAALFTIAKIWKQSKCPLADERIKKMWCVCVYICMYVCMYIYNNGMLPSHKKTKISHLQQCEWT